MHASILIGLVTLYFFYIIGLLFYMFNQRKAAIKNKQVKLSRFKNYAGETTDKLRTIKNHIENQFQIPVIFFVACLFSIQQEAVSALTVIFASVFVLSRFAHTFIHLGSNHLIHRALSYFVGLICIGLMLLQTFIHSLSL